jgi:hypothetical protein
MQRHKRAQGRRGARKSIIDVTEAIGAPETSNVTEAAAGTEKRSKKAMKREPGLKGGG